MKLKCKAPMRIDLAGGTLDIAPLYLFEEGAMTINAAITIYSEVEVETGGEGVRIISEDLGEEISAGSAAELDPAAGLDLLARIVRFYNPVGGLVVRTRNNVHKGSGLGASSSLLVALSHAMNHLCGGKYDREQIINFGADLEAQTIRVPTGKQDYYSATYGSLSAIKFGVGGGEREAVTDDESIITALESRLVVTFAGAPRFSGSSNWHMLRAYIDGEEKTVRNVGVIKRTAVAMRDCLRKGDLETFGKLLGEEWENRKGLAAGVTNETIDKYIDCAARAGAVASKICGAGGGGCMVSFCREGAAEGVRAALTDAGAEALNCGISRLGVTVEEL